MTSSRDPFPAVSILAFSLIVPPTASAQAAGVDPAAPTAPASGATVEKGFVRPPSTAWTVLAGGAEPVSIAHSLNDRSFALLAVVWHRVMTRPRGPSVLRGQLEVAVELVPVLVVGQRATTYGYGFSPIFFRWSMRKRGVVAPFAEILGGALRTDHEVPEGVSRFNFTAQSGLGLQLPLAGRRSLVFGYRLHHISNGGLGPRSPSLNSNVVYGGLTLWRQSSSAP
ncbi:MAG: acyloxyacyl hydrolase [Acidobacteria bacterium]|nr:acyloxyacyl hydrolase [Acidobacteriota bacterium]